MRDQAERLRELAAGYQIQRTEGTGSSFRRTKVLAVTSGKGGVGKTNLAVNLSYALMGLGRSTLLLDADLGLANVDVLLGTAPPRAVADLVVSGVPMADLIYEGPGRVKLVAGGSGVDGLADLDQLELGQLVQGMKSLDGLSDFLLVDTAAGVGRGVTRFALAADIVLLVCTPEPTAMTDAYTMTKMVWRQNPAADIRLIMNMVEQPEEATEAAERLAAVMLRFLGATVDYLGSVPIDRAVPAAVKVQRPLYLDRPDSPASKAIQAIAQKLLGEQEGAQSGINLFFDRLTQMVRNRGSKGEE